jgi:hypothetical protein
MGRRCGRAKQLTAMEQQIGLNHRLEVDGAPPNNHFCKRPRPRPAYDVSAMPAALPVKQRCFGDPASTAQGVKLGNPRNMRQAAEKGREAQRAAADQSAANALPVDRASRWRAQQALMQSQRRSVLAEAGVR